MSWTEDFFRKCGGTAPVVIEIAGGEPRTHVLHQAAIVVGRSPTLDVVVADEAVAPRQLYLQLFGGGLFGVNLSADVPVTVNGRLWESGWLTADLELCIGTTRVRARGAVGRPAAAPANPLAAGGPLYGLDCLLRTERSACGVTRPVLLVGRSRPSKLRVPEPLLHPVHAALVHTPGGPWVVDLTRVDGVRVNGQRVAAAPLEPGDAVELGPFRMWLRPDTPEALAPVPPPAVVVEAPAPMNGVLKELAEFQQKNFDQFRQMTATVLQMVGAVIQNQQEAKNQELDRMERILMAVLAGRPPAPAATAPPPLMEAPSVPLTVAPPAPPTNPPPAPPLLTAPPPDLQLQLWLEQQLGTLEQEQKTLWSRLLGKLKG